MKAKNEQTTIELQDLKSYYLEIPCYRHFTNVYVLYMKKYDRKAKTETIFIYDDSVYDYYSKAKETLDECIEIAKKDNINVSFIKNINDNSALFLDKKENYYYIVEIRKIEIDMGYGKSHKVDLDLE